ncbi:MAG: hypothetical protein IIZ53_03505 [Ruminococcus sp.]|nr:hypothetical protein [Ruminococcus sp.]
MINVIIIAILAALFILSVLTVLPEKLIRRNSAFGKLLRNIRIRLREKSRTSFCVVSLLMLFIGLITHDKSFRYIWAAVGIMLLTLIILHPEDILSPFRTRRKARKKKEIPLIAKAPVNKSRASEARLLEELTPVVVEETASGS